MHLYLALKSIGSRYTSGDFAFHDNAIPFPSWTRHGDRV